MGRNLPLSIPQTRELASHIQDPREAARVLLKEQIKAGDTSPWSSSAPRFVPTLEVRPRTRAVSRGRNSPLAGEEGIENRVGPGRTRFSIGAISSSLKGEAMLRFRIRDMQTLARANLIFGFARACGIESGKRRFMS